MSKRRSLNRRSSKFWNRRSSAGSNVLNPDSNFLEEEQPYWWNSSTIQSTTNIPFASESTAILNLDSNLQSTEEEDWWKHLEKSVTNTPAALKDVPRTSIIPEKENSTHISFPSTSESEGDINSVHKKKVLLRKTARKSQGNNAFLNALSNSLTSVHSEPTKFGVSKDSINNSLPLYISDRSERSSKAQETSSNYSKDDIQKRKVVLRKKRQNNGFNVFTEILSQEDTSIRRPSRKSNSAESQLNHSKSVNNEVATNVDIIPDSQSPLKNHENSQKSTSSESSDEGDNIESLKLKSRRRAKQNEERNDESEKSITRTSDSHRKNETASKQSQEETLLDAGENDVDKVNHDNDSSTNSKINRFRKIKRRLNKDLSFKESDSVVPPTQDVANESLRSRKSSQNISLPKDMFDEFDDETTRNRKRTRVSENSENSENAVRMEPNQERAGSRSKENVVEIPQVDKETEAADEGSPVVSSKVNRSTRVAKSLNASKGSAEGEHLTSKESSKDNANSLRLRVSDSDGVDVSLPHPVNQSMTQKDWESEISLSGLNNLNTMVVSTPIVFNRGKSRGTSEAFVESKRNSSMTKINPATLASIREHQNEVDEKGIRRNGEKRKSNAALARTSAKRAKSFGDEGAEGEETGPRSLLSKERSRKLSAKANVVEEEEEEDNVDGENVEDLGNDVSSFIVPSKSDKARKSSIKTNVADKTDAKRFSAKSVRWDKHILNRFNNNSLSRIVSEVEEEVEGDQMQGNLSRREEAEESRRKSRSRATVVEEEENLSRQEEAVESKRKSRSRATFFEEDEENRIQGNSSRQEEAVESKRKSRSRATVVEEEEEENLSRREEAAESKRKPRFRATFLDEEEKQIQGNSSRQEEAVENKRRPRFRATFLDEEENQIQGNSSRQEEVTESKRKSRSSAIFLEEEEENLSRQEEAVESKRKSRSRATFFEEDEENQIQGNSSRQEEAVESKRKSRSRATVFEEEEEEKEDDENEVSNNNSRRSLGNGIADEEAEDVESAVPSFIIHSNRKSSAEVSADRVSVNVENDERNYVNKDDGESSRAAETNVSGNAKRARNVPSLSKSRSEETIRKRRTVSRVSERQRNRSPLPSTSTSKEQRTINDFFRTSRPAQPAPRTSTTGIHSRADKEKFERAKKKLEEMRERYIAQLEAQIDREKSAPESKAQRAKVAKKGPSRKRRPTEVDKAFLVNGQVYRPRKLPRPKRWVTDRLYKHLWKCMEPKYKMATKVRSEKFILALCEVVDLVNRRKKYENYKDELEALMREMARLAVIRTPKDFYDFAREFLPYEFREKTVPMLLPGNVRNIPFDPQSVFRQILPD